MAYKKMVSIDGFASFDFDMNREMEGLRGKLGDYQNKAPQIMKSALNKAAKAARKENTQVARKRYILHDRKTLGQKKLMKLTPATNGRLTASLQTKSLGMGKLSYFGIYPRKIARTGDRPDVYKGRVLKRSGRQVLLGSNMEEGHRAADVGSKAFVVQFKSGHTAVVYRQLNRKAPSRPGKLNKHTQALWEVHAPSIMSMSARSFKEKSVHEQTRLALTTELTRRVGQILSGK